MAALLTDFKGLSTDGSVDEISSDSEYKHSSDEEISNEVRYKKVTCVMYNTGDISY